MSIRLIPAMLACFGVAAEAQVVPSVAPAEDVTKVAALSKSAVLPTLMATQPNIIADLTAAVSPAVVNIRVTSDTGEVVSEGHGSGFVITPSGEVVTNHHVIDEGTNIEIEFNNGVSFDASIIGSDPETDIALLQIESDQTFPTVRWHDDTPVRVGEFVVPIGNPFGIGQSVSFGIISAIGRDRVDSGAYVDYIQTDATVNTGNSGGPLFDLEGNVVAINSAIYSPTGASVGIAFAIPHYHAETVIETLRRDGAVRRGYLGVGLRTGEYSDGRSGAVVDSIVPGGPAQLAGLQIEDIIVSVGGTPVGSSKEATRLIGNLAPGERASFGILRSDKTREIGVTLSERPEKSQLETRMASLPSASDIPGVPYAGGSTAGLALVDLSSQFRSAIGMGYDEVGVYVESVAAGSGAERAGVKMGDVLMEFEMEPISSVTTFSDLARKARDTGKTEGLLKVRLKNGSETYVSLPLV